MGLRLKLKQTKKLLLLTGENVIKENTDTQLLPKNYQIYRFVCPKCGKRFRQRGSLKKHTRANVCPSQPFACIYCDQCYTDYKSVTKYIRKIAVVP